MSQSFKESSTYSHQGIYILVLIWMEWLVPVLELDSVVKGHRVYKTIRTQIVDETLQVHVTYQHDEYVVDNWL